MNLQIPKLSLVVLVGPSGCGKSSFAAKHFLPTEVVGSDAYRGVVSDDETSQDATEDAFDVLHYVAAKRLQRGRLTVVDATNVQSSARAPLVALARKFHVPCVAIVLNVPEAVCQARNQNRPDRAFGAHVVRNQVRGMRQSLRGMSREGFMDVHVLPSVEAIDAATIERLPLWTDRSELTGPFDIVGDVHGCADELFDLLARMGYEVREATEPRLVQPPAVFGRRPLPPASVYFEVDPPQGRTLIFVGDLVDRGPDSPRVLKLAMSMVRCGTALAVPGNHDDKLLRHLRGREVRIAHGLQETIDQLAGESAEFRQDVLQFFDSLVSHVVLDGGKLVVAHAGLSANMHGRASQRVRDFCLYGDTTGETDEFGLPVRYPWAAEYRGRAAVVYGHTPVPEPEWLNGTINIDTGCVFGGQLTALRYPERQLVSVASRRTYFEPARPFAVSTSSLSAQQAADDVLDFEDVSGKRRIDTRLARMVTIHEANVAAALETISRFAADPRWLIYLPPTMSPSETSSSEDYLERPEEAFRYFEENGVNRVICEEKHMGSRAVVIVCRDAEAASRRFGVTSGASGAILTRTGRHFFDDRELEEALLAHVAEAAGQAGLWRELETDWLLIDAELMPWSAKAQELIRSQYAAVGTAATASTRAAADLLRTSVAPADELRTRTEERARLAEAFVQAYRRYCWPVKSLEDYKLAPFHLLASEGAVHIDKPHTWHMEKLAPMADGSTLIQATRHRVVDLNEPADVAHAVEWWEEMTARGGEGMVVKPLDFVAEGEKGLIQPAIKCRGREYLRIIYGPEYTMPENLKRLKKRGLRVKRSLASREFALGIEAMERFVRKEPLRRVHECVFAVLALESEPVDPRL